MPDIYSVTRTLGILCCSLVLLGVSFPSNTLAADTELKSSTSIQESLRKIVPVSGEIVSGVSMCAGTCPIYSQTSPPVFSLILDSSIDPKTAFCLSVSTRDGRYFSRNTFGFPNGSPPASITNPFVARFSASFPLLLQAGIPLDNEHVSVKATLGRCEEKTVNADLSVFPVLWETPEHSTQVTDTTALTSTIHLIAGRNRTYVSDTSPTKSIEYACSHLPDDGTLVAFDTICTAQLTFEAVKSGRTFSLSQEVFGRRMPADKFRMTFSK